ncbi:MAG: ATP-binding cassette domain-containing protein [Spirochaetaceae bacterium]|nr:ATP-binding cassette domain-containing protein [Spirochaetaceae bacterium]
MNEKILDVKNLKMYFPRRTRLSFNSKRHKDGKFVHLEKSYVYAVDDVSFYLNKGEALGLVGESGCGKSTVIRAISQLYTPTEGEVLLDDKNLIGMKGRELLATRRNMQIVFQNPYGSLNPRMTTAEIIAEPMRIYKKAGLYDKTDAEIDVRIGNLMEMVGLLKHYKNRYPHEFSGGQRQRIGIARAIALNPQIVLADEPVSALDVSIQAQILNLFKDIQKELGISYLFVAHDLSVVKFISNRIAVMYLGKIVETADRNELYSNPQHPYTQALLSSVPIPDPEVEAKRKRIILTGDVPSPTIQRPGCAFYDRCSHAMSKCKEELPILQAVNNNGKHKVACWLYQ